MPDNALVPAGEQPGQIALPGKLRRARAEMVAMLDSQASIRRLRRLEEYLDLERQRQAPNRYQQALDDDFFDGLQFSDEDAAALIERGQAPLVYNKVAPTIRWVTGTEKRTRIDFKVYPRSDDDAAAADAKTKLLKYVQDVNKSAFARSAAFAEAMKVGVGWLECGIRSDPTDFIIYDRAETWRNILYDSLAQDPMQSDWRYIARKKIVDLDICELLFPWRLEAIRSAASASENMVDDRDDEWYLGALLRQSNPGRQFVAEGQFFGTGITEQFNRRTRVPLYEMWYRYPTRIWMMQGGPAHGQQYDPDNPAMVELLASDAISLYDRVALRMRCAVFIRGTLLQDVASPYRHDRFPFTPIWGNRRARDGMAYGMTRNMRDPQEDFNKRMSKALFAISTRRITAEKGAVDDWEELRLEAARPDAILVVNPGKKLELHTDVDVAQHHIEYAQLDAKMIQDAAGVTDENMGRRTNATSGVAIEARQEQGAAVTADYFDNLRLAIQLHGEKLLSLTEQYVTMPMQLRILGERQGYDFMPINWAKTGATGQPEIMNDITASQADFVVSQQDFRESMREAAFSTLMEMLTKLATVDPEFVKLLLDDVLEMSNIPGKDDIVATIRDVTGKVPRDKRLTPEEQAAQKERESKQAQEAAAMKLLQLRGVMAEIQEKEAKAKKMMAEADVAIAEAQAAGKSDAEIAALQQQYQEQLVQLREDTSKLIAALRDKVAEANRRATDQSAKVASEEKVAFAKIAADERVAKEKINSDASVKRELEAKSIDVTAAQTQAKVDGDQKIDGVLQAFDKFAKDIDAQLRELRVEQREQITDLKAEQQQADAKRAEQQMQKETAAPAAPPTPIVVVVPGGEDSEVEKHITIQSNADGVPQAAVVKEVRKKPSAKKPK